MKKPILLVFFLSLVAYFGYSQSLSLVSDGNPVANDQELVFTGEPSSPLIAALIGVTNSSSATVRVLCKKVEIFLVPGSENSFCWDVCYPPNIYVSLNSLEILPGETNEAFSGDYQPLNFAGQSIIRYVFFNESDPNDSICFKALFNVYPLGIENLADRASLSSAYPNPASTEASFNYSVEEGVSAYILVRNVLGATVKEIQVTGSGVARISTLDLSEGVYFYSMVVNGKTQSTRKLVVSH